MTGTPLHPPAKRAPVGRTIGLVVATALVAASGTALGMRALSSAQSAQGPHDDRSASSAPPEVPQSARPEGRMLVSVPDAGASREPAQGRSLPSSSEATVADSADESTNESANESANEPTNESADDPALSAHEPHAPGRMRGEAEPVPERPSRDAPAETSDPGQGATAALVDEALAQGGEEQTTDPELPAVPDRTRVASRLRDLEDEVRQCAGDDGGVARARLIVDGTTGRVRRAEMEGDFAGTETGSCIARTLHEQARLPRFARERFEIAFPYVL